MEEVKLVAGAIGALLGIVTTLRGVDNRGIVTILSLLLFLWLAFIAFDIVAWCLRPQTLQSVKICVVVFGTLAGVIAVGWFVGSVRKYQFGVREPMSYGFGVPTGIALLAYLVWEIVDNVRFDRHGNPRLRWYDGKYSI